MGIYPILVVPVYRTQGGLTASHTVGLVVEYAPATGETRVRFPDGVDNSTIETSLFVPKMLPFCPKNTPQEPFSFTVFHLPFTHLQLELEHLQARRLYFLKEQFYLLRDPHIESLRGFLRLPRRLGRVKLLRVKQLGLLT